MLIPQEVNRFNSQVVLDVRLLYAQVIEGWEAGFEAREAVCREIAAQVTHSS